MVKYNANGEAELYDPKPIDQTDDTVDSPDKRDLKGKVHKLYGEDMPMED